jgi:flagellar biosynthesis GTPase FlhF
LRSCHSTETFKFMKIVYFLLFFLYLILQIEFRSMNAKERTQQSRRKTRRLKIKTAQKAKQRKKRKRIDQKNASRKKAKLAKEKIQQKQAVKKQKQLAQHAHQAKKRYNLNYQKQDSNRKNERLATHNKAALMPCHFDELQDSDLPSHIFTLGPMDQKCTDCSSVFFKAECLKKGGVPALCCKHGKIKLTPLNELPDVLFQLLTYDDRISRVTILIYFNFF